MTGEEGGGVTGRKREEGGGVTGRKGGVGKVDHGFVKWTTSAELECGGDDCLILHWVEGACGVDQPASWLQ